MNAREDPPAYTVCQQFTRETLCVSLLKPYAHTWSVFDCVLRQRIRENQRIRTAGQLDSGEGPGNAEQFLERAIKGSLSGTRRVDQGAVDVEEKECGCRQAASPRTLPARGPLAEGSSSNDTR
jgi:hypothetical protein